MGTGLFDNIGDVAAKVQQNYMKAGHYIALIRAVLAKKNRKLEPIFVIETTIIHVYNDEEGIGHQVGEDVSHVINMRHDMALPNIKRFLCSILERPEDDITPKVCDRVVSKSQPLAGTVAELQNRATVTKAGNDFTDVGWRRRVPASVLMEELDEETQARFFPDGELEEMLEAEED